MNQIVIQTAFIGDALLCIPLLRALKEIDPNGQLHLVCRAGLGKFFSDLKLVDKIHEVKKGDSKSYKEVTNRLSDLKFSILVSPHESLRSAMLAHQLNAENKIGFKKWWNFWSFDRRVQRPMFLPDALRQLSLLSEATEFWKRRIGEVKDDHSIWNTDEQNTVDFSAPTIPKWASLSLPANDIEIASNSKKFELPTNFVAVAPGSIWATKRWVYFQELVGQILNENMPVVLLGGKDDEALALEISEKYRGSRLLVNLIGKTSLYESYLILSKARHLVCNDSGVMHLGAVAGVNTTAVFGPTTLALGYRPFCQNSKVVQIALKCRPCGAHGHNKCPIGTHECMKAISAQTVRREIKF